MSTILRGQCWYQLAEALGSGGMATVFLGRQLSKANFSRVVAIKRLHEEFARDARMLEMLLDEARMASRIHHPSIIDVTDVVVEPESVYLVMDFVLGEPLSFLLSRACQAQKNLPPPVASAILRDVLRGLHAAHEAKHPSGDSLELIHRDVSPQNVLVGLDGVARLFDFGVARARGRSQVTHEGEVKGKVAYMSPEYLVSKPIDRRTDIFSAGVVCWEALCGRRLFSGPDAVAVGHAVRRGHIDAPSQVRADLSDGVDPVVMKALQRPAGKRFATALEFAQELETAIPPASPEVVAGWVRTLARESLAARMTQVRTLEARPWPTLCATEDLGDLTVIEQLRHGREAVEHEQMNLTQKSGIERPAGGRRQALLAVAAALGGALLALTATHLSSPRLPSPPPSSRVTARGVLGSAELPPPRPPPDFHSIDGGVLVPAALQPPGPETRARANDDGVLKSANLPPPRPPPGFHLIDGEVLAPDIPAAAAGSR